MSASEKNTDRQFIFPMLPDIEYLLINNLLPKRPEKSREAAPSQKTLRFKNYQKYKTMIPRS
jgi:hypothetical protein